MAKKTITKLSELTPDANNYNKGTEFGGGLIEKSLRKLGAGRSILLDKKGRVIAGNKTLENAVSAGFGDDDLIVVQTTGKQIVAVQRMDLDLDSKRGKEMALADNATAKANIEWDTEALAADWNSDELDGWGVGADWGEGGIPNNSLSSEKKDPFDDDGITGKNAYGVIIMCETDVAQQAVFEKMEADGYTCKIVVV